MTILYPKLFNAWLPADFSGPWDWEFLNGALPRGGRFTDIDGLTEVNREFLFVETTDAKGKPKGGQVQAIRELIRLGVFTSIALHGKIHPERWAWGRLRWGAPRRVYWSPIIPAKPAHLWRFVNLWGQMVDAGRKGDDILYELNDHFIHCMQDMNGQR